MELAVDSGVLLLAAEFFEEKISALGGQIVFLSAVDGEQHLEHDIDSAIDKTALRLLPEVFKEFQWQYGFRLLQVIQYDVGYSLYCVFGRPVENRMQYLKFDFLCDLSGYGRYGIQSEVLIQEKRVEGKICRSSVTAELAYQISKRSQKQSLDKVYRERLLTLIKNHEVDCESAIEILGKMYPRWYLLHFLKCIRRTSDSNSMLIAKARTISGLYQLFAWPLRLISRLWGNMRRFAFRLLYPIGLTVYTYPNKLDGGEMDQKDLQARLSVPFRNKVIFQKDSRFLGYLILRLLLGKGMLIFVETDKPRSRRPKFDVAFDSKISARECECCICDTLAKRSLEYLRILLK